MIRCSVLFIALLICLNARGQCVVSKDVHGQVITTCEIYKQSNTEPSHKQEVYLGSPYLTYPAWQRGTIRIEQAGKDIACELAYDLTDNEVLCRFEGSPTVSRLTPYAFTINGIHFARQLANLSGFKSKGYLTVLHDGSTRLLTSLATRLVPAPIANGYEKGNYFQGQYQTRETYYIQKGDSQPEMTVLSKPSVLGILYEQSEKIAPLLTSKSLTTSNVIKVLAVYDSLMALANIAKPPLSTDATFNQSLHNEIKYPNQAWLEGVYGRVYVGFTVDEQGQLTDIVTLSPTNAGYGFDQEVKRVLKKVGKLKPGYEGNYILPIAFTYDHTQDSRGPYVPVNVLSTARYQERIRLVEHVVPIEVSKPAVTISEVWGYYE